jgi:hypothetical protein
MSRSGGDGLRARLQRLDEAVQRGLLSGEERDGVRLAVLHAEADSTGRLLELGDLRDEALVSGAEFDSLKAGWLAKAAK